MKKLLFSIIAILMAVAASAQKDSPTTSWPYLYPDFMEGELEVRTKITKALVNIHLNMGALHYVEDGKIKESSTIGITKLVIGEDVFRNVGGKMMKMLAEAEDGFVVEETILKELSRHEPRNQQAISMELSSANHAAQLAIIKHVTRQESRSSAGNCQADEQTVITQLSRPGSRD